MAGEHTLVPYPWRRWLGLARVVFAGASVVLHWWGQHSAGALGGIASIVYLAVGMLLLVWVSKPSPSLLMLGLVTDTVFFLLCADPGVAAGLMIAALWYGYLQVSALLTHGWQQIAIAGAAPAAFLVLAQPTGWLPLLLVCIPVTLLALLADWQRRQLEERIFAASRQAVLFRSESQRARAEERERIASDFHDGPLQAFMSVQMRLEVVRRLLGKNLDAGLKELAQLQEIFQSQVADMRTFLRSMRPSEVDASELIASLSRLTAVFQKDTGISVTFSGNASLGDQQSDVALEIVQMVREALNNVRKHAKASAVAVNVEQARGVLEISIDDNGSGFPFSGTFSLEELELLRLGPVSLRRRVRSLGGDLTLESIPGRGAGLRIRIPQ